MKVTPAISITDAMLVSTSVVEEAPPAYVLGASYPADATAHRGQVGGVLSVYKSLQSGNVGNVPESSPLWWQLIGTTYALHSPDATYAKGDRVIDIINHLVYESALAGNRGQSLTLGTAWLKVGSTTRWAPFDQLRSTQARAPVDLVYTIAPGKRTGTLILIGLDGREVVVEMEAGGRQVYSRTVNLSTRNTRSWRQYLFGEFRTRKTVQFYDLPLYRVAKIKITVKKPNGEPGIGGILVGNSIYIGEFQWKGTSDRLNFSIAERNEFSVLELQQRPSIPNLDGEVWFEKDLAPAIVELRDSVNAVPAFYSALDDDTHPYFSLLNIWGIDRRFAINVDDFDHGLINLQVEEL